MKDVAGEFGVWFDIGFCLGFRIELLENLGFFLRCCGRKIKDGVWLDLSFFKFSYVQYEDLGEFL